MTKDLTQKTEKVQNVTSLLENMRLGDVEKAPNYQRVSFNGTIQRLKYISTKVYSCKAVENADYFLIKRTR